MEYGFYHPNLGYWQAIAEPSTEVLASYPEETIAVPLRPSAMHTFDGSQWVLPSPEALAAAVIEDSL